MYKTAEQLRKEAKAFEKAANVAYQEGNMQHQKLCNIQAIALRRKARERECGISPRDWE